MAIRRVMNKLKTKISSEEINLEDLKAVAFDLDSFYKTNTMLKPQGLSPKSIYDELCLLPGDPDYTEGAREIKLHEYKEKLLSIISDIIDDAKSNNTIKPDPERKFLTKVRDNSLEVIFQVFDFIKIHIIGKGKKGSHKAFVLGLIVLGLIVLYVIKSINQRSRDATGDYRVVAETLSKDGNSRLAFYNQKSDSINNLLKQWGAGNIERTRAARKELINVTRKIDSLNAIILPDLELIKNKPIDSSRRSRLNAYIQILKNF